MQPTGVYAITRSLIHTPRDTTMTSVRNQVLLASLLILGTVLVPVWSVTYPPLTDYPNHLARMYILMMDGANRFLNNYYVIRWAAIPNLAMDLIVPTLGRFFGVLTAGKLFLRSHVQIS